jgi:hypothetical protein
MLDYISTGFLYSQKYLEYVLFYTELYCRGMNEIIDYR